MHALELRCVTVHDLQVWSGYSLQAEAASVRVVQVWAGGQGRWTQRERQAAHVAQLVGAIVGGACMGVVLIVW